MVTELKRKKIICYQMVEESDLCICGHLRDHHHMSEMRMLDVQNHIGVLDIPERATLND